MSKERQPIPGLREHPLLYEDEYAGIEIDGRVTRVASRWLSESSSPLPKDFYSHPQTVYLYLHGFGCSLHRDNERSKSLATAHTYFDQFHRELGAYSPNPPLGLAIDWPGYNLHENHEGDVLKHMDLYHTKHHPDILPQYFDIFTHRFLKLLKAGQSIPDLTIHVVSHSMGARAALQFFNHESFGAQRDEVIRKLQKQIPADSLRIQHTALAPAFELHPVAENLAGIFPLLKSGESLSFIPGYIWLTKQPFQTLTKYIISAFGDTFGLDKDHPYLRLLQYNNPYILLEHGLNLKNNPIKSDGGFIPLSQGVVPTTIVLNAQDRIVNNQATLDIFGNVALPLNHDGMEALPFITLPREIVSLDTGHTELLEDPALMAKFISSLELLASQSSRS